MKFSHEPVDEVRHPPARLSFPSGLAAHECILDLRAFKSVTAEDVAKRLMDCRNVVKRLSKSRDMITDIQLPVFTIGHSNLEFGKFVALLKKNGIQAVGDVRSSPYSQYNPQFNREPLQRALQEHGISYVFLGDELGARRSERECYVNDRADYALIAHTPAFNSGINRVIQGAAKMRIALMCSEKNPLDCHRCILVSPHLREHGLQVFHILADGTVESHEQTEGRLLHLFELPERELFRSPDEIVAEAYKLQGDKIAYQEDTLALREEPPRYGD